MYTRPEVVVVCGEGGSGDSRIRGEGTTAAHQGIYPMTRRLFVVWVDDDGGGSGRQ